jgi:hypothetical protein
VEMKPRRSAPFLVLALVALLLPAAPAAAQKKHLDSYKDGLEALAAGRLSDAERLFKAAIAIQPKEQDDAYGTFKKKPYLPHFQLGVVYHQLKDYRAALGEFAISEGDGAIQKVESYSELKRRRGICSEAVAKYDQAEARAKAALATAQKSFEQARAFENKGELASFWREGEPSWKDQLDKAEGLLDQGRELVANPDRKREEESYREVENFAADAAQAAKAVETAARAKLGELSQATAQALGGLDEAEKSAQDLLRGVSPLQPYPPRLAGQVKIVEGLVLQIQRLRETRDTQGVPAMVEQLTKETRTLRSLSALPPAIFAEAAEAHLAGNPAKVVELLSPFKPKDDRERYFQALLLAAAHFDQWVAGGERDSALWDQLGQAIGQLKALPSPPGQPAEKFFSPRFRELLAQPAATP